VKKKGKKGLEGRLRTSGCRRQGKKICSQKKNFAILQYFGPASTKEQVVCRADGTKCGKLVKSEKNDEETKKNRPFRGGALDYNPGVQLH